MIDPLTVDMPASFTWTPQTVDVTADPNASGQGVIQTAIGGITDFFGGLASLFDNGVEIYKSVAGQWQAAQKINAESAKPKTVVVTPTTSSLLSKDNLIKIGIVVAVGALALILIKRR